MVLIETNYKFSHPWTLTTFANWFKYPNEHASHVISVDVISRHINHNGHLVTDRLLQLKQPIPSIFKKLGFNVPEVSYFFERSILNKDTQEYEASSHSLTMRSFFRAYEVCNYSSDPATGGTVLCQKAEFTAFSYFSRIIEDVAVNRFHINAAQGRRGLETVISKIRVEADELLKNALEIESRVSNGVKESFLELEKGYKVGLERVELEKDTIFSRIQELHQTHNPFCGW